MVFDLFFYCVTVKTIYSFQQTEINRFLSIDRDGVAGGGGVAGGALEPPHSPISSKKYIK